MMMNIVHYISVAAAMPKLSRPSYDPEYSGHFTRRRLYAYNKT